jgi:hypothetical protein
MDSQYSPWPRLGWSHHLPFYSILCVWPRDQHPNVILFRDFPKLKLPQLWRPITLCVDLRLRWSLKQSCSPYWELSNNIWHTTWTQGNWGGSWLLMVESQIVNLTFGPSFGHNLCFRCPNGSCKPILNIYISRYFQWYKKILNPICFDPCNCSLKIWKSIEIPTPKVGTHFRTWKFIPLHSPTLPRAWDVTPGLPFWPTPL